MAGSNGIRKKVTIGIVLAVVLGGITAGILYWHASRMAITTDNAKVNGDLVNISPKVAGRLEGLYIVEGQIVKKGEVIAKLEDSQYRINLEQAEGALELAKANYSRLPDDFRSASSAVDKAADGVSAANAQVKAAEVTLADAERQLKNAQALYEAGALSQDALNSAQSNYAKAEAALLAAKSNADASKAALADAEAKLSAFNNTQAVIYRAQLKQAQAAYDNAKLALENTVIKAPTSGTVLTVPVAEGENLSLGQTIATISDLNRTWITANIMEKKIGRIKVGQKVDIRIDAYPGRVFPGRVAEIGGATQSTFSLIPTENTSGNFTKVAQRLPIKITVTNRRGLELKPGMSAVVKIYTR